MKIINPKTLSMQLLGAAAFAVIVLLAASSGHAQCNCTIVPYTGETPASYTNAGLQVSKSITGPTYQTTLFSPSLGGTCTLSAGSSGATANCTGKFYQAYATGSWSAQGSAGYNASIQWSWSGPQGTDPGGKGTVTYSGSGSENVTVSQTPADGRDSLTSSASGNIAANGSAGVDCGDPAPSVNISGLTVNANNTATVSTGTAGNVSTTGVGASGNSSIGSSSNPNAMTGTSVYTVNSTKQVCINAGDGGYSIAYGGTAGCNVGLSDNSTFGQSSVSGISNNHAGLTGTLSIH